jgi:hypothetical protein
MAEFKTLVNFPQLCKTLIKAFTKQVNIFFIGTRKPVIILQIGIG